VRRPVVSALAGLAAASALFVAQPARAGSIDLTSLSSGSIGFTVSTVSNSQAAGSQSFGFSLTVTTGAERGTVTITAPSIVGSQGNLIATGAFEASCVATNDPSGVFTSSGTVRLSSSAVTCATIASHSSNKRVQFDVTLYLDESSDGEAFSADTYHNGVLTVTAAAP
jgi:hypothetical protein